MKQFTALVLTLCVALMGLSGFAEEAQGSDLPTVEDLKARIESFEQNHPELESLFPGLTRDLQDIYQEEMTTAFTGIQTRFGEMLEAERERIGASEESLQQKRETLNLQASILNAGFIARLKTSFEQMIAVLRGREYTSSKSVTDVLKDLSAGLGAAGDDVSLSSKAQLDQILETVEKEYGNDLYAWFKAVSAPPELPENAAGRPEDDSRPEPPPKGEKPADEGEQPKEDLEHPFMDHFTVIHEELQAASGRIDERMAELAKTAPEKYQISEDVAGEAFGILSDLFRLVNAEMMKQLQINEMAIIDSLVK